MANQWLIEAAAMQQELSAWRRALHQTPETGLVLPGTAAFVKQKLDELGVSYTTNDKTSNIVATIGFGGKCFMLRSDMDALPFEEQSGEPFASKNGNMHACGHDLHCTTLLGAAKLLKVHESELKGTVKLLFQAGEEVFAGASAAIDEGVLQDPHVDAAMGMHVASNIPCGIVAWGDTVMSSAYGFKIRLTGKGAHGSTPELGVDPINTAVHIHLALQELLSREVSANEECALTIGRLSGGTAANVIPETAEMEGTLRTFKPEVREHMIRRIGEVARLIGEAYRTKAELEVLYDVPMCVCEKELTQEVLNSVRSLDANIPVLKLYHAMGSEDFSFFTDKVPCTFLAVGAGVEDKSKWVGLHNPKVVLNEKILPQAAAIYAKAAFDWLENHAE